MSPEQASADVLDGRSDLYSLALVLFEMVAGRLPFEAERAMQMIVHHINTPPRPLSEVSPWPLPPGLEHVVMRALGKKPAERYTDADAMRADLEAVLSGEALPSEAGKSTEFASTFVPGMDDAIDVGANTAAVDSEQVRIISGGYDLSGEPVGEAVRQTPSPQRSRRAPATASSPARTASS